MTAPKLLDGMKLDGLEIKTFLTEGQRLTTRQPLSQLAHKEVTFKVYTNMKTTVLGILRRVIW
jgi:hypothetical protein